jgi:hypothetical protein
LHPSLPNWRVKSFANADELRAFAREARGRLALEGIDRDAEWLSISHDWRRGELIVLSDECDAGIVGQAVLSATSEPLEYALGDHVFHARKVPHFSISRGPVSIRPDSRNAIVACLQEAATALPAAAVLSLKAVAVGSDLHAVVEDRASAFRRRFHVLPWGKANPYCRIRWEGTVEAYLESIGKETRRNLKRYAKKLFSDQSLKPTFRRFGPAEADAFVREVAPLIERTWQRKANVVQFDDIAVRRIRFAADCRGFLGYILFINDQPAAYRYCFIQGRTAVMFQTGFDPAWAPHRVSNVLFLEVLADFERSALPVDSLDFLPHVTPFKLHTTNDQRLAQNYYLIRRDLSGTALYASLAATGVASRTAGAVLDRFDLRPKTEALMRRMFGRRNTAESID